MALGARLQLRQRQTLIVTPQLQQAIKLLQLSNLDLQTFVEREVEQNPFLEHDGPSDQVVAPETFTDGIFKNENAAESGAVPDLATALKNDLTVEEAYSPAHSEDWEPGQAEGNWGSASQNLRNDGFSDISDFADLIEKPRGLGDHLAEQLTLATRDPQMRMIGRYLIDLVDEAGYLRADLEEVAERLGAPLALMDSTLSMLQTFDPAGVAARNLAECLALQLREKDRLDPYMMRVLDNLDLVGARDIAKLRRVTGLSVEDLNDAIAELKLLNPKPGLQFGVAAINPVTPDVFVRRRKGGGWIVEINQETLPKVLINQTYYATVSGSVKSDVEKSYVGSCMTTANWLVKSLDQRTKTILKVAQEIIAQQDAFLVHGVRYMRPLNLRDVAEKIKMHESTVSRVTSNKYIATPRGMFELKYFFTSAIQSSGYGEQHSSEAVRDRIRQMINAECPSSILSDDQIVSLLRKDGVDIARRTVAKYREAMRISSSVQRRRQKRSEMTSSMSA